MIKDYYVLAKPGLVYGNIIPVIGGFALAAATVEEATGAGFNFLLLVATMVGISLVMASGCVFNNIIDRDIDGEMARTKTRALVRHTISTRAAFIYGVVLGAIGFATLIVFTNWLTTAIAAIGFFFYVVVYSLWAKRGTSHGALVGSIAGAAPPVVGYCAVTDRFDAAAVILFAILVIWQMPHFYAIAIYRFDDYAAAKVPVLPVKKGILETKIAMLFYIIAFIATASMLFFFNYEGVAYLSVVLILGLAWLALCIKGFFINRNKNEASANEKTPTDADKRWARKMFFLSLIVMMGLFLTIIICAI